MLLLRSSVKKYVLQRENYEKLCELDALVFEITNWLMHKYYRRFGYRGNNSCFLSRLKATGYLDY